MMDCFDKERIEWPASAQGAIAKLPKCLQVFFSRDLPKDAYKGNMTKAMKVVMAGIRSRFGKLEGKPYDGLVRYLSRRQGLTEERIKEIATNLGPGNFHCDLIKKHSKLHEDVKCQLKADYIRLMDMEPNLKDVKTVEVTWTELGIITIPSEIRLYCENNDFDDHIDLSNNQSIRLVGGMNSREEQTFITTEFGTAVCSNCGKRKLRFYVSKFRDTLNLMVKDLDVNIKSWEAEVEPLLPCYVFPINKKEEMEMVKRFETANKITMSVGLTIRNTNINVGQKILECKAVHDTDKRFSYTSVSDQMMDTFRAKFSPSYQGNLDILCKSFAGWIGGRDWEKECFLIWCFSAPDDPMTIVFIGDSRVGKSDMFVSGLNYISKFEEADQNKQADCDVVLQGENIRRTVFYIHKRDQTTGDFKLVKGKALRAQHGRLFIDSITGKNQEIVGITREAIPQGKMIVGGAGATQTRTIDFVTRYGVSLNLVKEFHNYPTRYNAWKEGIPGVFEYFDFKRFSLVVPFGQDDVKASVMRETIDDYMDAKIIGLSGDEFRMLKIFCDGLDKDRYHFEPGVEDDLGDLYEKKMGKFEHSYIHPYSSDLRLHLRKMVKGIAFIGFRFDGLDRLYVKREHVRRLEQILDKFEERWSFGLMLLQEQQFKHTVDEVFFKLKGMKERAPKRYKIYSEIARQGAISIEDLARETKEDVKNVYTNVNILIRDELVSRPSRSRYSLSHLGTEVYKKIMKELESFMVEVVSEDVSDIVFSQIHGCKTDHRGWILFTDILWICPGLAEGDVYNALSLLKQKGLVSEPETAYFEIV